jgi:hypothetical protein
MNCNKGIWEMPRTWSDKYERQYEHIKKSARQRGRSLKVAKRIAAATVNKKRSKKKASRRRSS